MPSEITEMIKLEGVCKSYGQIMVLGDMNLRVSRGKSLCILGRSGCGKSTLLKLIALITRPDRGCLSMEGRDITKMSDSDLDGLRREKVAYTFQEPLLMPYMTALENVRLVTREPKARAANILSELGLKDRLNQRPAKLSGGEKKRVDVARAVLKGSPVVVADEPLSNLDPETGLKVMNLLRVHLDKGGVLIYSAVEPSQTRFADDILRM
jgi:ABC-type lipoprotein export system ATPase subunit